MLLCTERSRPLAPDPATHVLLVEPGSVPELAAGLRDAVGGRPVVGLGGGRVVDVAKAITAADGTQAAAIPTTLAGSAFTPFHRLIEGAPARMHRPSLVVCEPAAMVPGDAELLAATAMNSLAHAMESLYAPGANPVTEEAALRAARLYSRALPAGGPATDLAEAAFLAGYAVGVAGLAVHHAVCQTIVRTCDTPHAQTNAVMLPHSARLMESRTPAVMTRFSDALGGQLTELAARSGHRSLSSLGVEQGDLPAVAGAAVGHPGIGATPDPPQEAEILELLQAALR